VGKFISEQVVVERPADDSAVLSEIEQALVRYAVEELDGAFTINRLYERYQGDISKRQLSKLARRWEHRGWLTEPEHAAAPRCVTDELVSLAVDVKSGDTLTRMIGGDTGQNAVTGTMTGDDTA
jgi:hypothetical protein